MLRRYATLNIAPYKGFVNPRLELVYDTEGGIIDVRATYTEGYAEQMLRYSREYATLPEDPTTAEQVRHPEPSDATLEAAKALRGSLRHAMDGQVASSMRSKGLYYGINLVLRWTISFAWRRSSRSQPIWLATSSAEMCVS